MGRVLIVSPRFPPSNAPDMHRVRQGLRYLSEFGWDATVLAVDPALCDAPLDPMLERTVPHEVPVVRTRAVDVRWTRRLGFGALDLRALPFVARAGDRLLGRQHFDLVYFSTTAFSLLALGPRWLRRFGVPYVIDLQDPWWSDDDYHARPGAPKPPGGRMKYMLSRSLARVLEPRAMRRAAHVISVSPAYPPELVRRYPRLADRTSVLPFGAPAADFELLTREPFRQDVFDPSDGRRHWVYVGAAGPMMRHSLTAFFDALRAAREDNAAEFDDVRLHFVGTDYASGARARRTVEPIARACGVADLVEERPHRIPYFEALQCLLDAEALVVPGSDDPGYTASKIFPYILAQKPLLAVFHERSSVVDVLRRTRAGIVVPFADSDTQTLARAIGEAWFRPRAWSHAPVTDRAAFEPYTAREMTRRQCEIFDRVVAEAGEKRRGT